MAVSVEQGYIPDKLKKAEKRLEENPWDTDAWSVLIRDAQAKAKAEEARPLFERVVAQFPTAGRYWKTYIEYEMKYKNYERVEKLFQRSLIKVLNIELWRSYLNYVKETKGSLPTFREKMAQAYDFALEKIGMDIMSYSIWTDYVAFLKGVDAIGSYAENQRITAVRRVYQKGCITPMISIEQLWKDYIAYESSVNHHIADKMISDRSRDYMNARKVAKEYEIQTRGLNRNAPSVPPQNTPEELKQAQLWKQYIAWEKSNPLKTEDYTLLTRRVMFAYEQCLLCLGYHPDIWYEAAMYLDYASKTLSEKGDMNASKSFSDEAATMYDRATSTLLKKSMLLYFAHADFEESRNKYERVHQIYGKLLAVNDVDPTLTYIQYMKFARRAEGIKNARSVFKLAREDLRCQYHVFVAAALMEYYCSKDKQIAFKIFELGLKKYNENGEYILSYIDYLSHINEDNNTRVLFERVLTKHNLPPESAAEIWNKYLEFESSVGDLSSVLKVEKRRTTTLEKLQEFEGKETALLVDRYKYLDLYPCNPSELKAIGYQDLLKQQAATALPLAVTKVKEPLLDDDESAKKPKFPRPDIAQMIPFKPKQIWVPGMHPIPGGSFPPPPAAAQLLTMIPPPICYRGPFVNVDKLCGAFEKVQLQAEPPPPQENGIENRHSEDAKLFDFAAQLLNTVARKRKSYDDGVEEGSDDDSSNQPPSHDIYRLRQQKKVK